MAAERPLPSWRGIGRLCENREFRPPAPIKATHDSPVKLAAINDGGWLYGADGSGRSRKFYQICNER
jgi:hypothetical protein